MVNWAAVCSPYLQLPRTLQEPLPGSDVLQRCLDLMPVGHRDRRVVSWMLKERGADGFVSVDYLPSAKDPSGLGRCFSQGKLGVQGLSRHSRCYLLQRRFCGGRRAVWELTDLDMVNAFPVILHQVLAAHGKPCTELAQYVAKRDARVHVIMADSKQRGQALTYDQVKVAYLVALHNGNYRKLDGFEQGFQQLDDFQAELRACVGGLAALTLFRDIFTECKDSKPKNALGRFVSVVCQRVERAAMAVACVRLQSRRLPVRVQMFDGLMVQGFAALSSNERSAALRDCEQAIREELGLVVSLAVKAIKPLTDEEFHTAIRSTLTVDAFDVLDTCPELVTVSTRYLSQALWCDAEDEQAFVRHIATCATEGRDPGVSKDLRELQDLADLYLRSSWGVGKTCLILKRIKLLMQSVRARLGREARILIVSPRVSLSLQYLHDLETLGFVSYQDPALRRTVSQHGCLPTAHFPRVIYQVDSLGRAFGSDTPKFDMIVVDELCQLEAHVFQETGDRCWGRSGGAVCWFALGGFIYTAAANGGERPCHLCRQ